MIYSEVQWRHSQVLDYVISAYSQHPVLLENFFFSEINPIEELELHMHNNITEYIKQYPFECK